MQAISEIAIVFTAFAGFFIAWYIHHKKRKKEHLVCPLYQRCDQVIHSEYSKFLGFPIEVMGMGYYLAVAFGYGILLGVPMFRTPAFITALFSFTAFALLFSIYLTFIQAFTLREFCTWCLTSAAFCVIIFSFAVGSVASELVGFFAATRPMILLLHLVGAAIGLGAATITDIFFFRFLKDFKISEFEAEIMHTLSQIIWAALAILLLSGVALYLPKMAELHDSSKFLVKIVIVGVIIANGALLNLFVSPRLIKISFGQLHEHIRGELHTIRRIAFALGAVSIVSWYGAFALAAQKSIPYTVKDGLTIYFGVILAAILASQLLEKSYSRRARE